MREYTLRFRAGLVSVAEGLGLLNPGDLAQAGSPRDKASGGKDSNGLEPPVFPFYYLPHMLYSKLHEQSYKKGC